MSIRCLTPDDAAAFKALRLEGLMRHPEAFGASFDEEAAQPLSFFAERLAAGVVFGGFDGNAALQGVIGLRVGTSEKTKHTATIWGMFVTEDMRGTGLAKALLQMALTEAATAVTSVRLSVVSSNEPARRLYERAGFKAWAVDARALCINGVFFDELLMRLDFD